MHKFKTESKRLLDMMANSIYTNTDIFVRELISNASDALDKKHYLSLTDTSIDASDLHIQITLDPTARTFTISDNGIGMDAKDLEENLGTIAQSGSLAFKQSLAKDSDVDIIGQFGVGFYSAFMVADRIEVLSRKCGSPTAYLWTSQGVEGYEITESKKAEVGTTITLHIKEDTEEKKYQQYLDEYTIVSLIKKYSDFVRYPIRMQRSLQKPTAEEGKTETVQENQVINSMLPLWKKNPKEINEEEYTKFYEETFFDYQKPLQTLHYSVEGNTSYTALLYIPEKAPYDFYTTEYRTGIKLYSRGVFIKDEAKELISDYFRFVRGLIDADDISLNISREILQEDQQMQRIKKSIDKKVASTLEKMMKEEREKYETFFRAFGTQLKYGAYQDYGLHKDLLIDLLLFKSSYEDKYVSLAEYVSRMKEGQTDIYYAVGENSEKIKALPQTERLLDQGYEILYFTESVDEFMATVLANYQDKPFKSVQKGQLDVASESEKEEIKEEQTQAQDFLTKLKNILQDKVSEVRLSTHLKSYPVCLVADDGLSLEMEKVLQGMHQENAPKAKRILEINKDHPLYAALKEADKRGEDLSDYAKLLYDQALLIAGFTPENPSESALRLSQIMLQAIHK